MEDLTLEALARRVEALERDVRRVSELEREVENLKRPPIKDWRLAAAIPFDPEFARQVDEAGRAWREEDRRLAREAADAEDAAGANP